jgi:hypothetical protein
MGATLRSCFDWKEGEGWSGTTVMVEEAERERRCGELICCLEEEEGVNDIWPCQKRCFKLRVFLVSEQRCIDGSCHGLMAEESSQGCL